MEISEKLFELAKKTRKNAYVPYSNYKVGAAICSDKDNIYASCNVENISYPCGTCAEAGAIAAMVANGDRKIKAILVMAEGENLVYPCGACLQRIAEFSSEDTIIYLANTIKICEEHKITELLPYNFKEGSLLK